MCVCVCVCVCVCACACVVIERVGCVRIQRIDTHTHVQLLNVKVWLKQYHWEIMLY